MTNEEAMRLGARCDLCPLRGNTIVPPEANKIRLRLIIVGEGPGRGEEKLLRPFVGQSGKLLQSLFDKNGIKREECYITNAALCRGEGDKENDRAAECCAPRALGELSGLPSRTPIVTLGKPAARTVLGVKNILLVRGFIWTTKEIDPKHIEASGKACLRVQGEKQQKALLKVETLKGRASIAGRTIFPTVHPAFILRADTWNPIIQIDFRRIGRYLRGEIVGLEDESGNEEACTHLVGGPELLRGMGEVVSVDVETDGVKPLETKLLCVGISDGEKTVVIWPWKHKYARPLSKFLRTRKSVVGHNGFNFDQIVLAQHGVR